MTDPATDCQPTSARTRLVEERLPSRSASKLEAYFGGLLEDAGVHLDGSRPWDLRVHDRGLFRRVLTGGSLALGEAYMDGAWDCERLDEFFCRVLSGGLEEKVGRSARAAWMTLKARLTNRQKGRRAFVVGKRHYDLGNEFFRHMLDERMTYSCGYWKAAKSLEEAQEAKLELLCRKLGLEKGQRLLDVGCGWGSLAGYAAERHGVEVMGVTVSAEQARFAAERYAGLPVEVRVQDYRSVRDTFDHVVSVGMFEHVGAKNYRTYMEVVDRCLRPGGRFALHTIGRHRSSTDVDPWIEKYIFPNSMLPSAAQITAAAEGLFALRDWHAFGHDYDPTLLAWHENFERSWPRVRDGLDERFRRMWRYYLLASAGSFRADDNQLWQIVFTKPGSGGCGVGAR